MDKRSFNIAYVNAEIRAKLNIKRFEKEFEDAAATQKPVSANTAVNQIDATQGNIPQQPQYGG